MFYNLTASVFEACVNLYQLTKFLDLSQLKAFADDIVNMSEVIEKLKFVLERVENSLGKGENAGYQHFLLFPECFQKASFSRWLRVGIVW